MPQSQPSLDSSELEVLFDEEFYLKTYPDIAARVQSGKLPAGRVHFLKHGYAEGRVGFAFNAPWYLRSYPVAEAEIRAGLASTPQEHFAIYGAGRGYLPHPKAERPDNAAQLRQRFGGLWVDAPNALDQIQGRLEIGAITEQEAESLREFRRQGYVVLQSAIPPALLEQSRIELEEAYEGRYEKLQFECRAVARDNVPWRPEFSVAPSKALDIHMFSATFRDLMFSDRVLRFLNTVFDCQPLASQTLGFLRGSAQEAHQDSAYVAYTIPRQFAASWIALEDVVAEAGELFYYPGSHRFEDFLYAGRYKSVSEGRRADNDQDSLQAQIRAHVASLAQRAVARGLPKQTFMAKAGDVLIWHADLAHGGLRVSPEVTRKSLVTHYCPRFQAPLFMEGGPRGYFQHDSGAYFTSGHYPGMLPID